MEACGIHSCAEGWLPVYADGHTKRFPVVSIGFLLDNPDSAVIWRGPRKSSMRVSLCDVSRELGFCMKTNMKVIGLIENMSGYKCPNCAQCTNVFSYGGAEALAVEKNVRFLGRLPFDPALTAACDRAGDFQSKTYTSENTKLLTEKILSVLSV
ncbi:unnamed protein product [Schistosoma mattheei]|uniref:Uncharacterized protein n=1 Tax=Schistosoma mattheei TaxID=31246 RepID=A0A183PGI0_9TREM|nr:unnamed protein product [Schistosoma mattheei]